LTTDRSINNLDNIARIVRGDLVKLSNSARTPHLGSSLSCVDILVALYWNVLNLTPENPDATNRDRFILSKGHAATTLYAALNRRGYISGELLESYATPGGVLPEHPIYKSAPGIEATSGSLGHGLSLGLGMALSAKINSLSYRVYILLSDGECNEGSVWEAALMAPAQGLDNLVAIVDFNKWQATGRSEEITALKPLAEKFESFGWSSYEINGHQIDEISNILNEVPDGSGKPVAVITHTVKGKGVSFMEDDNNWHYRIPDDKEVLDAMRELELS
jgi:transketolase|tara:strand:- start:11699 stop:12526 length:828 start_codon:yes stop_codon:yes gene_type:complete